MTDEELSQVLQKLMDEYAQEEGARYIELNEKLKADPSCVVPKDVEERALRLIDKHFPPQTEN